MLQNFQYDTIMREYNRRQTENRRLQEKRIAEVYERFPEMGEIDRQVASLSLARTKALLSGASGGVASLKEEVKRLSGRRRQLLLENGYPADYLEIRYHCPNCQDTGYIGDEKCVCFKKAMIELFYEQSNFGKILEKENFKHFSFRWYSDTIVNEATGLSEYQMAVRAVETARNFIRQFGHSFQNLFLFGDTGVGKTFLSHCISYELMQSAHWVVYFSAFELFDLFSRLTFSRETEVAPWLESIFSSDLLVIDDLGTEVTNSFISSQLFRCIQERIRNEKSTIISTNLGIREFSERYSERTFSRIVENYEMIKLTGQDIRKQKLLAGGSNINGTGNK